MGERRTGGGEVILKLCWGALAGAPALHVIPHNVRYNALVRPVN